MAAKKKPLGYTLCGKRKTGVYCRKEYGHTDKCDQPKPKPVCGEYKTSGDGICMKKPGHRGDHK